MATPLPCTTFEQKVELLEKFKEAYLECERQEEKLLAVFPHAFESSFFQSRYKMEDLSAKLLADALGIQRSALSWFIHENHLGSNELACSCGNSDEPVVIDSCEAFLKFELAA